jgi:hypothetical protein
VKVNGRLVVLDLPLNRASSGLRPFEECDAYAFLRLALAIFCAMCKSSF